jgi:hypothetical protein
MVGAKLEMVVRVTLLKNTDRLTFLRALAKRNVVDAQVSVKSAFVKVETGELKVLATSETASTTKMALMSVAKISSVNLVKNLTKLEAEKTEATKRIPADHSPVQAYRGRNGSFMA